MKFAEYGTLLTEAYDLDKPEAPPGELAWHRKFIGSNAPVLALMCGSGRFLVPLAAEGIDIDGVDASPAMLAACRTKLDTNTYEQKLHELDLPRKYACAFIGGGGSFGLITRPDEALQALRRIRAHLVPGGRLCFEAQTPAAGVFVRVGRPRVRSWVRPDGGRIVLTDATVRFEGDVCESIGTYQLFVDGRLVETELNEFPIRFYTVSQMCDLLARSGFTDVTATKAYTDEPSSDEDMLVSYVAGA